MNRPGPRHCALFLLFALPAMLAAQVVSNPSFEGPVGCGSAPAPWVVCSNTPDTQIINGTGAGIFGINQPPSAGLTYECTLSGMTYQEPFGQLLPAALVSGVTYSGSIDLYWAGPSFVTAWNAFGRIQFWGGNALWGQTELLWSSPVVNNLLWQTYPVNFTPTAGHTHFTIVQAYEVPLGGTGSYVCLDNMLLSAALPVDLRGFEAERTGMQVALRWHTGLQEQAEAFEVHRAGADMHFEMIAQLEDGMAVADGDALRYAFRDAHPEAGENHYRLKMRDGDGHMAWSEVRSVNFADALWYRVYPNPVREAFWLETNAAGKMWTVTLRDLQGRAVFRREMMLQGKQRIELPGEMQSGTYILEANDGISTQRISLQISR